MGSFRTSFLVLFLVKCLLYINPASALYEDQIKKFDWTQQNIGEILGAQFETSDYNSRLYVATKENVLAALCPRTGKIIWRRVFEKNPRGLIRFFHFENDDAATSSAVARTAQPRGIITVTGHAPAVVRGWSPATGYIAFEWSVMPVQHERAESAQWFYHNTYLYNVIPVWGSHLEVTKYASVSGLSSGMTAKLTAPWIQSEKCTLVGSRYACLERNQLVWLDLIEEAPKIQSKTLNFVPSAKPVVVKGRSGVALLDDTIISFSNDANCQKDSGSTAFHSNVRDQSSIILSTKKPNMLQVDIINANNCEKQNDLQKTVQIPEGYGKFSLEALDCKVKRNNQFGCNFLYSTEDGAIIFTNGDGIRWTREESLSKIATVEFIDLPLSDAEGAIENELNSKQGDVIGALLRRLYSQISQVKHLFSTVLGVSQPQSATQKAGLVRDAFGLHKMMVVVTSTGKLFGIDNLNSKIHWLKYLPGMESFANNEHLKLIVQRTSKHFPHQPTCSLISREKSTGNGLIYRFNPITGQPVDGGFIRLEYQIKQMAVLRDREVDFLKPLMLLDSKNGVHVLPEDATELADGFYMFTADQKSSILEGFAIEATSKKAIAKPIWKINLNSQGNSQRIVKIAGKNPNEHVHSQGRVLGDRSVLYKYINPNLVSVVTQSLDPIHKYVINVYLIDVVSGSIVYSMAHRKAREPLHIVHSENWLVYSYYNDKVRRTEITTVELYEGKVQTNSSMWSSLDALPVPLIEKQSYILPANVETMRETITERGITNKHVLIGISSGAIIEMPWALLDPRRPVMTGNQPREEGSIPYIPELPLPTENIVNYNQSIARIENIHTAPSGLESTCLVVAYGLDIFVTRVSPSKTFDLLKEDFDYFLITVVLIALSTGSFFAKHLSARKALKQAWK